MNIWVDGDACPNVVKEILFRAAVKRQVPTTLVANQAVRVPPSPFIEFVQVPAGFDVADNYIVQNMSANDIVITGDIPLAAEVIDHRGHALNPRGQLYHKDNIQQRLDVRNMLEQARDSGQASGGPPAYGSKEKQAFANALDRLLTEHAG